MRTTQRPPIHLTSLAFKGTKVIPIFTGYRWLRERPKLTVPQYIEWRARGWLREEYGELFVLEKHLETLLFEDQERLLGLKHP